MEVIPYGIVAFTLVCVYVVEKWEQRYIRSVLDWIPAVLLAYVIPAVLSYAFKFDYSSHTLHTISRNFIIPFAIIAVMSSLSLSQLKSVGYKPILLFVMGSMWIALFPLLLMILLRQTTFVNNMMLEDGFWRLIPPIIGSWIGGSTSQLVLKELSNCPEDVFLMVLVLDNVLVNIWTLIMFQCIKRSDAFNKLLRIENPSQLSTQISEKSNKPLRPLTLFLFLLVPVIVLFYLKLSLITSIIILSILGLLVSNFIPKWNFKFVLQLGSILIILIMAILGLKLRFDNFVIQWSIFLFLVVWLISHYLFMLLVTKMLNLHAAWVPIASMANVGGIATAPAVTSAYEKAWMPHAIVLAVLSMATGTFWGMFTIYLIRILFG